MAQTLEHLQHDTAIELEKLGVSLGFLAGLAISVGLLLEPMAAAALPGVVKTLATIVVVAASTRAGLALGRALSSRTR